MYPVSRYHDAVAYLFLYFSFFSSLSLWFSDDDFRHIFLSNCEVYEMKHGTHMDSGWTMCIPESWWCLFLYSPFFCNIQTSDEILCHTLSVTMKIRVETWYTLGQWWIYHVYQNHDAAAYSLLYCSISLSLQFSNIKNFHHSQEMLGLEGLNLVHVEFTWIRLWFLIYPFIHFSSLFSQELWGLGGWING